MEKYLLNQNNIGKNKGINDIKKINIENKKRNYSETKKERSGS